MCLPVPPIPPPQHIIYYNDERINFFINESIRSLFSQLWHKIIMNSYREIDSVSYIVVLPT